MMTSRFLRGFAFFCVFSCGVFFIPEAQASLVVLSPMEEGINAAQAILIVKVRNKAVKPTYKTIQGKKRLNKTTLEVFGTVQDVLLGSFKGKSFNGSFQWENLMVYDNDGNEAGTKSVLSKESGEEGTLEEASSWIIYLDKKATLKSGGKIPFFRAESEGTKERILSIICNKKALKSKMPGKGRVLCEGVKKQED